MSLNEQADSLETYNVTFYAFNFFSGLDSLVGQVFRERYAIRQGFSKLHGLSGAVCGMVVWRVYDRKQLVWLGRY